MPDPLPPDIWFLIWRGRYWSIRREGDIMIAGLVLSSLAIMIIGFLLAAFIHWGVGLIFGLIGIVASQWCFASIRRKHTNTTMSLEEWKRQQQLD